MDGHDSSVTVVGVSGDSKLIASGDGKGERGTETLVDLSLKPSKHLGARQVSWGP